MERRGNTVSLRHMAEEKMRWCASDSAMSTSQTLLWSTLEHPGQNDVAENSDKWRRRPDKSRNLHGIGIMRNLCSRG